MANTNQSKKVYAVRVNVETVAMVLADSEDEALETAEANAREAIRDSLPDSMDFDLIGRITSQDELGQHGWDELCVPYGGNRDKHLCDLLPPAPQES